MASLYGADRLDADLEQLTELLQCKICYDAFTGPVTTACSHSFCSTCIRNELDFKVKNKQTPTCPLCRAPCDQSQLYPNDVLRQLTTEWAETQRRLRDGVASLEEHVAMLQQQLAAATRAMQRHPTPVEQEAQHRPAGTVVPSCKPQLEGVAGGQELPTLAPLPERQDSDHPGAALPRTCRRARSSNNGAYDSGTGVAVHAPLPLEAGMHASSAVPVVQAEVYDLAGSDDDDNADFIADAGPSSKRAGLPAGAVRAAPASQSRRPYATRAAGAGARQHNNYDGGPGDQVAMQAEAVDDHDSSDGYSSSDDSSKGAMQGRKRQKRTGADDDDYQPDPTPSPGPSHKRARHPEAGAAGTAGEPPLGKRTRSGASRQHQEDEQHQHVLPPPLQQSDQQGGMTACPLCNAPYPQHALQSHVELCLARRDTGPQRRPQSMPSGRRTSAAGPPARPAATASRTAAPGPALPAAVPHRPLTPPSAAAAATTAAVYKPSFQVPPKLAFNLLKDAQLRKRLLDLNIDQWGLRREAMERRYQEYRRFLQAAMDGRDTRSAEQLRIAFISRESELEAARRAPAALPSSMRSQAGSSFQELIQLTAARDGKQPRASTWQEEADLDAGSPAGQHHPQPGAQGAVPGPAEVAQQGQSEPTTAGAARSVGATMLQLHVQQQLPLMAPALLPVQGAGQEPVTTARTEALLLQQLMSAPPLSALQGGQVGASGAGAGAGQGVVAPEAQDLLHFMQSCGIPAMQLAPAFTAAEQEVSRAQVEPGASAALAEHQGTAGAGTLALVSGPSLLHEAVRMASQHKSAAGAPPLFRGGGALALGVGAMSPAGEATSLGEAHGLVWQHRPTPGASSLCSAGADAPGCEGDGSREGEPVQLSGAGHVQRDAEQDLRTGIREEEEEAAGPDGLHPSQGAQGWLAADISNGNSSQELRTGPLLQHVGKPAAAGAGASPASLVAVQGLPN